MDEIRATPPQGDAAERAAQAERLRKMLLAMVEDIRVVLIKLAERTQALRFLMTGGRGDAEPRQRAAREVLDLFAPLANRLGVWQLKWELEDLSLRALEPDDLQGDRDDAGRAPARPRSATSRTSSRSLRARARRGRHPGRGHRPAEAHLQHLEQDAAQAGRASTRSTTSAPCASSSTTSRTATRRSASSITCGRRCRGEFDDYIAKPKANNYRSLHTAVIGPEGKPLEVQIRTREMHQHSEYGVAAHWRYKEGGAEGHAPRSRVRGPHRVAAAGARLEGRGRRCVANGSPRSRAASSPTRSTC